ncbi:MAG: hypothetical protein WBV73_17110 [Phormidium sp.]
MYNFSTAIPIKKGVNTDPAKCHSFSTITVEEKVISRVRQMLKP